MRRHVIYLSVMVLVAVASFITGTQCTFQVQLAWRSDEYFLSQNIPDIQETTEINRVAIVTPDAFTVCNDGGC